MELFRFRKLTGKLMTVIGCLLSSGCFYSDAPLLNPTEYVQPIRAGLWENLVPVSVREWEAMASRDRTRKHCRAISAQRYCGERVRITTRSDGSYRLAWDGEKTVDRAVLAAIANNSFIVEQDSDNGSAEYALATQSSADAFMIRIPDCERDLYLRAYVSPAEDASSKCRIIDRRRLFELFADYLSKSSPADAKLFQRIGG